MSELFNSDGGLSEVFHFNEPMKELRRIFIIRTKTDNTVAVASLKIQVTASQVRPELGASGFLGISQSGLSYFQCVPCGNCSVSSMHQSSPNHKKTRNSYEETQESEKSHKNLSFMVIMLQAIPIGIRTE